MITPKRVHSITNPTKVQMTELFKFMQERCDPLKEASTEMFLSLMSMSPCKRLAANLHFTLERMTTTHIRNVLEDGLSEKEKSALLELELHSAPDELLSVAHGLLNVHERWFLMKSIGSKFRSAAEKSAEFLQTGDLLKDLLEGT